MSQRRKAEIEVQHGNSRKHHQRRLEQAAIIPGKSDKSPLVWNIADLIEESEMPPLDKREKYPALTKDQIGLVRAWIDQGAK